jgi:hypothetical protein
MDQALPPPPQIAYSSPPPLIKLYTHDPRSLLPLLKAHLPYTIPIIGTITSNPVPLTPGVDSSAPNDPSTLEEEGYTLYATFSKDDIPSRNDKDTRRDEHWVIITAHFEPNASQSRLFCSAETSSQKMSPPPNEHDHSERISNEDGVTEKEEEGQAERKVQELVRSTVWSLRSLLRSQGRDLTLVGGVNVRWCQSVKALGKGIGGEGLCDIWIAPASPAPENPGREGEMKIEVEGGGEVNGGKVGKGKGREGLMVDTPTVEDAKLVSLHTSSPLLLIVWLFHSLLPSSLSTS